MRSFEGQSPDLEFPCPWIYTLFGRDEGVLRAVAGEIAGAREHRVTLSKRSAKGTYVSVQLEVTVADQEEQRALFTALGDREEVAYLL